ncbi:pilus assembly FimT family protein [Ferrimonas marina]|uniref:Prepilin-type N-terminal cleavage/methylation domain-containing protein n=1 Tax=Ferrimonas marina TaxID=299255 RepID=A0A1M5P056_9GAMM|nr:prepilin-type N-terminal cleavage/methylation domain-containing protein [Ferrimonas marina]SHG94593.1 hypothetical protein SAMN02745129_1225 [Ferrimonas marina]
MVRGSAGLTLVELMVVIALIMLLMLLSAPIGATWMDQVRVKQGMDNFNAALDQARALALRNPGGVVGDAPAVGLRLDGATLGFCTLTQEQDECLAANLEWQVTMPNGVLIQSDGQALTSLELNSFGLVMAANGSTPTAELTLSKGNISDSIDIL